ncbi:hypothetical protein [Methanorbis rubei]|uniref:Uncharacterized protein n=1 Tax=Methanorbis rubei TaxID=3028300 RepID=A0AAE4SBU4_9EURY|nr:hypothetical protein [Methanocorpusculaceae archaeon Cs1]
MNRHGGAFALFCILLFSFFVTGFAAGETVDGNDTVSDDGLSYGYSVSRYSESDDSLQVVVIDIDTENRFSYGERGLVLADSFDPTSIPQTYDRAAAREALGYDLYMSNLSLHSEIVMAYQARYPELPYGDAKYIYHYGNRLTLEFRPDGSFGKGTFSTEYTDTPPASLELPYTNSNSFQRPGSLKELKDAWKEIMSLIHGEDFDVYHMGNSSNRRIAHSL